MLTIVVLISATKSPIKKVQSCLKFKARSLKASNYGLLNKVNRGPNKHQERRDFAQQARSRSTNTSAQTWNQSQTFQNFKFLS